jgi:hypothetical protein
LRITLPDYNHWALGSGFGDLLLGVKQQIGHSKIGFDASLIVFLSLPSGANAVSNNGYDPRLQLALVAEGFRELDGGRKVVVVLADASRTRNLTGESTFLFDRQITGPWDAFVEYAADLSERGGPRHLLHFGTAYKVAPSHQLDLHFGLGISRAAVDHFIGVGYSFRVQIRK